jgi:hypothetical protein
VSVEIGSDWGRSEPPVEQDNPTMDDFELEQIRFNQAVSIKADGIRVYEAAKARVQAEKATATNFDDHYLNRSELFNLPAPEPLIERVLPRHAYGILRGRDHSFKSFVAIDWALCLATGKSWQGHGVTPVRVLYIAGEGAHGLARRIEAWEYAWGHNVDPAAFIIRATALNLHQPGPAFDDLLRRVEAGGFGLVVIDTLRRVSGAADGNSSEMGLVVDNLDRIKQATDDGTVLAVAHTDKGDHDTRGYSGIEDDADFVWAAKRDDNYLTLDLTKFKDGPDGRTIHLEATTTLRSLTLTGLAGAPTVNTTESQLKILDAIRDLFPDGATGPTLMSATGLTRPTFYRALRDLVDAGQVLNTDSKRRPFYELPALLTDDPERGETHPPEDTDA